MWQAAGRGIIGSSKWFMRDERLMKRRKGKSRREEGRTLSTFARSHIDNCRINKFGLYESYVTENSPISYVTCHNPVRPFSDGHWFGWSCNTFDRQIFPGAPHEEKIQIFLVWKIVAEQLRNATIRIPQEMVIDVFFPLLLLSLERNFLAPFDFRFFPLDPLFFILNLSVLRAQN